MCPCHLLLDSVSICRRPEMSEQFIHYTNTHKTLSEGRHQVCTQVWQMSGNPTNSLEKRQREAKLPIPYWYSHLSFLPFIHTSICCVLIWLHKRDLPFFVWLSICLFLWQEKGDTFQIIFVCNINDNPFALAMKAAMTKWLRKWVWLTSDQLDLKLSVAETRDQVFMLHLNFFFGL